MKAQCIDRLSEYTNTIFNEGCWGHAPLLHIIYQEACMFRWLSTTLNPEAYHGSGRRPPFFEGWYFKVVNAAWPVRGQDLAKACWASFDIMRVAKSLVR